MTARGGAGWLTTRMAPFSTAVLVFLSSLAFYAVADPTLSGDEPHYVVYAKSIARGWGFDLQRAYQQRNYGAFYAGTLEPHARRYTGPEGRLASWHGVGLPVLLVPFARTNPTVWVLRLVMITAASALAYHLFLLVRSLTHARAAVTGFAVAAVMVAPPTIYYSGQVYPELLAALLVVIALRCVQAERSPGLRFAGAAIAAAVLPWLNLRYITLTAGLAAVIFTAALRNTTRETLRGRVRCLAATLRWPSVSAALLGGALVAFNIELFGAPVPEQDLTASAVRYYTLENLYTFGVGGLIGLPSGILPLAPILLVATVAIPRSAWRLGTLETIGVTSIAALYVGFNAYFGSPGWCPPGRYQASVVPLLAVPLTVAIASAGRYTWLIVTFAFGLTSLSVITSAEHFARLYTPDRRNIQPMAATASLWPIALSDPRQWGHVAEAPSIAHQVGVLERVNGSAHLVAREGRDSQGALAFGPYIQLWPGEYRSSFELYLEPAESASPAATVDVSHVGGGVIAEMPVPFPGSASAIIQTLDFQTEGTQPIEFRVFFTGRGLVGVRKISVELLNPHSVRRMEVEWWKAVLWALGLTVVALRWRQATRRERIVQ